MKVATEVDTVQIHNFRVEQGTTLDTVTLAFETFGVLNSVASNAILIEHALTGDSHVTGDGAAAADFCPESGQTATGSGRPGWWEGLVGPGLAIDTNRYFVVCANVLGGCAGTTGPASPAPDGVAYGSRFPAVNIRDMVNAEVHLAHTLGIRAWHAVIGGSMGGARALEWALMYPHMVENASILAAPAYSTADQIAWAHTQLGAIELDPNYCGGDYVQAGIFPATGLGIARQIAHLTYRAAPELNHRFGRSLQSERTQPYYSIESYLDYQAQKLTDRFDAQSYVILTAALRDHDVRRHRSRDLATAVAQAQSQFHVLSLSSDRLYPPEQVEALARALPGHVDYAEINTWVGHDGFLTETQQVGHSLAQFLAKT